jgi:putative transposase
MNNQRRNFSADRRAAPSDQGSQFTANEFTALLEQNNIRISRDGKGRALDNIFIERFWHSLK